MTKVHITTNIEYDMKNRTFTCRHHDNLTLTHTQSRCFEAFLQTESGQALHKDDLIALLWGKCNRHFNYEPALIQKIYLLRKALSSIGLTDIIVTIPRFGYQINENYAREICFSKEETPSKGFISGMFNKISIMLRA